MADPWVVFVEGKSDEAFVRCLLQFLNIDNVAVERIGGGVSRLSNVAAVIKQRHDAGNRISILLDANSDLKNRRKDLKKEKKRLNLPIECEFFLPDDKQSGCLETLLERMAVSGHRAIYDCFDSYEDCLRDLSTTYETPNLKARIYAYCQVIGAETGPHKKYDDPAHWDLNAPDLDPLKQFLRGLI